MNEKVHLKLLKVNYVDDKEAICQDIEGKISVFILGDLKLLKGDILKPISMGKYTKLHDSSSESACLFVTNKCNSNCIMCPDTIHSRQKNNDIKLSFLQEYLLLLPTDLPFLDITGGEPTLLKNDLLTLIDIAIDHFERVSIMLLSNGRAFADKNYSHTFYKYKNENMVIEVPLHGFDSSTHDRIAGGMGCFLQTITGIQNLLNIKLNVGIRIVISKLNYKYLHKIIRYIGTNFTGIRYINLMGLEMLGNAYLNKEKVWIEFEEIKDILQKNIELCFLYGIEPHLYNFPLCLFDKKYWSVYRKSISLYKIIYLDGCLGCGIKNSCGGFFKSTAHVTDYICKGEI